jgi:hypothetical protein
VDRDKHAAFDLKSLDGMGGRVKGRAAEVDLASLAEQASEESALADLVLCPLVPQDVMHD